MASGLAKALSPSRHCGQPQLRSRVGGVLHQAGGPRTRPKRLRVVKLGVRPDRRGSQRRRVDSKKLRGRVKALRRKLPDGE